MKYNRLGMILIGSALLVIALVVALLVQRQQALHAAQIRVQGLGVTRSLVALPMSVLAPADARASVLHSLFVYHENPDFAYAAVTSAAGAVLADAVSPGAVTPPDPLPTGTTSLFGERTIAARRGERAVREFYGPVMERGNLMGYVRVGYVEPAHALALGDVPFFALLALTMFLMVPLLFFMIKREMAPLGAIGAQLQKLAAGEDRAVAAAPRDVRDLADKLQCYLAAATARIDQLEQDGIKSVANSRLLEYGSNKMSAVLQCMPDGLMILDPLGEVTFASSKIEPLLGVPMQDILGSQVDAWCRDPQLRALLARYRGDSLEPGRQSGIEFSPLNVPGKQLSAIAQPLVGGHGLMAFGTLVVMRDVTREYLGLQAGNDFVAHVSHELKSPLNVIAMYAETLAEVGAESAQLRVEALNVIQDEVERMNSLVNNLLNVSKLETGSMSPERHRVRLDDLLNDAFEHALPRADAKSMKMDISLPRELAAVSVDKDLFRIAVNNLLSNAIKYSAAGARVTLSAREDEHEIEITVRDAGIGIAPEHQARVFDKFYRAREGEATSRAGHGLGLYLAAQIVELHHGRLTLESALGEGSAFSIHLKKMPALPEGANVL